MKYRIIMLALLTAFTCLTGLRAQEDIEIINENGQRVGNARVQIQLDQDGEGQAGVIATAGRQFKIEGDKIIIVDENGETQEIDIAGAKSVSVQQSVKTVNKDGDQQTVMQGKAIIITPDGERTVIELGGPLDVEGLDMPAIELEMLDGVMGEMPQGLRLFRKGLPGSFRASASSAGKYMIGVNCEPVSDELRAHLDLNEGVGLIVQSVVPGTPSEDAGIEQHDILITVEDKELANNQDLIDVVQSAGKAGHEISLIAVRGGKEVSFTLKPTERPEGQFNGFMFGGPDLQFRQFGPGIIIGDDENAGNPMQDMQIQMEAVREQMKHVEEMMRDQMENRQFEWKTDQDQDSDVDSDRDDGN